MRSIILSAICGVALAASGSMVPSADNQLDHEFSAYCSKYGKVYEDVDEYERRKELYKETDNFIREQNSRNSGYKLGHNPFSDMSKKERNFKLGLRN